MKFDRTTWTVGALIALSVAVFAVTLIHTTVYSATADVEVASSSAARPPAAAPVADGLPSRLIIPKLSVDAHVQHVGLGKTGNMAVPTNFTDVGWYRYGTVPGARGSAVIDGHVDNGLGLAGVFKEVSSLQVGDDIYVETDQGTRIHFVVDQVAVYPYKAVPDDLVFNRTDEARLNLITCEGTWVEGDKTYDHRIVIYSHLIS